jgi:hypothetical protein
VFHCDPAPVTVAVTFAVRLDASPTMPVLVRVLPFSIVRLDPMPPIRRPLVVPLAAPLTPRTTEPELMETAEASVGTAPPNQFESTV